MTIVIASSNRLRDAIRWMAISWIVWTVVILLDVASVLYGRAISPAWFGPLPVSRAVVLRVAGWYAWWLWTPVIFYVAHRFRFEAGKRVVSVLVHAVVALAILRLDNIIDTATRSSLNLAISIPFVSFSGLVQYAAVAGAAVILDLRRRERSYLLGVARLESQLAQSRTQALTAQLRPHFLFNALNSVAMLIRGGAHQAALESVLGYSELLRRTLDTDATEVPLRDELAFLDRYLAIERMRFSETLSATIALDPDIGEALVPNLILQPLVENALRHGLSNLEANARLEVIASRHDGVLRVEVRDNGSGLPADWRLETSSGVGLRTTRSRLREYYGDNGHHFEVHSRLEGGTAVIVQIPYRTTAMAGAT